MLIIANSQDKNKIDKIEEERDLLEEEIEKEEETEDLGFIDPMGITDKIADKHIAVEKEVKKLNARLNVHKHVRNFLIVLVKIAQKHAKENPNSELAGIGMMLFPIAQHLINAIVEEVKKDPEDLIKLIEFFYLKLNEEGFFIEEPEEEKSNDNKNG